MITYKVVWVANDGFKVAPLDIVKLVHLFNRVVTHLRRHCSELILRRESKDSDLLDELATFGLSWENGSSGEEFSENAANCPHIDGICVVAASENQLRGSVIPGDNVGGVKTTGTQNFGATEVTNFNDAFSIHQNVFWLQVSVADTLMMRKSHSLKDLTHKVLD